MFFRGITLWRTDMAHRKSTSTRSIGDGGRVPTNDVAHLPDRNARLYNLFGATWDLDFAARPTVKSIGLFTDPIRSLYKRGMIGLIPFWAPASRSSLPSEQVDEPAIGPDLLDVGAPIDRWQRITGKIAVSGSPAGQAFSEVQENRSSTDRAVGDHQQRRG
jgi:hypothetical protein